MTCLFCLLRMRDASGVFVVLIARADVHLVSSVPSGPFNGTILATSCHLLEELLCLIVVQDAW